MVAHDFKYSEKKMYLIYTSNSMGNENKFLRRKYRKEGSFFLIFLLEWILLVKSTLDKKMKFSIKDFFSKCICKKLRIWSHVLKTFSMENFIFWGVQYHHCYAGQIYATVTKNWQLLVNFARQSQVSGQLFDKTLPSEWFGLYSFDYITLFPLGILVSFWEI